MSTYSGARFASSKFFGGGASSSSSDNDSDQSSEEVKEEMTASNLKKGAKYMLGSDDEEEEERIFKSGATKRAEALEKVLDETRKHANIADFFQLDTDIAKLEAEIKKAADQDVFEEKGAKLPVNVLQLLVLIEDTINEVTPDQKKKMSKNNSQSYNKVKQKFRKFLSSTGDDNMVYEN